MSSGGRDRNLSQLQRFTVRIVRRGCDVGFLAAAHYAGVRPHRPFQKRTSCPKQCQTQSSRGCKSSTMGMRRHGRLKPSARHRICKGAPERAPRGLRIAGHPLCQSARNGASADFCVSRLLQLEEAVRVTLCQHGLQGWHDECHIT